MSSFLIIKILVSSLALSKANTDIFNSWKVCFFLFTQESEFVGTFENIFSATIDLFQNNFIILLRRWIKLM